MKMTNKFIDFNEDILNRLKDAEYQKEFLNASLEDYMTDGDFKSFYKSLELVIKARGSVSEFAKNAKLNRRNLYSLFNGEKTPRLDTIVKLLNELGYSLKIA